MRSQYQSYTLAAGASTYALQAANIHIWPLALIVSEFFLLYLTAAQATYAASFYVTFAEAIENEPQALGPLRSSESPIILAMRSVGAIVLLFWFGIMLAVLTLIVFSASAKLFVLIVVPVASFFSFLLGSAVFIAVESKLRRSCRRAVANLRLQLDAEARMLISNLGQPDGLALQRLDTLNKILGAVTATDTGAIFLIVISIVTPFAAPVVSLLVHFLGNPIH